MKKYLTIYLLLSIAAVAAEAQTLSYREFIDSVMGRNHSLLAEKMNIPIGEAQLKAARSIPNPSLSAEYGNNSDWSIAMGQSLSFGIEQTITPGVTVARKHVAGAELTKAELTVAEYELTLKAEATAKYLDALLARELKEVARQTMEHMQMLADGDSVRYAKGDISQLDMLQTRLEARMARQDYLSASAEYANILVELDAMMGNVRRGSQAVEGTLEKTTGGTTLLELLENAKSNRPELHSAEQEIVLAQSQQKLARRERLSEIDLSLGVSLNSRVANEEAPAPEFVGYTVGVGVPLPFSNANKGVIKANKLAVQQAELSRDAMVTQIETEVRQAYNNYLLAQQNTRTYSTQLITDAETILQGRLYAYQRGETTLLEVLTAQQTYNEVMSNYYEALHNHLTALVEMQRVAGNIDIEL